MLRWLRRLAERVKQTRIKSTTRRLRKSLTPNPDRISIEYEIWQEGDEHEPGRGSL